MQCAEPMSTRRHDRCRFASATTSDICLDCAQIAPLHEVVVQVHAALECLAARGVPVPIDASVQAQWRTAALDQAVNSQAKTARQMGAMHAALLECVQAVASSEQLTCSVEVWHLMLHCSMLFA